MLQPRSSRQRFNAKEILTHANVPTLRTFGVYSIFFELSGLEPCLERRTLDFSLGRVSAQASKALTPRPLSAGNLLPVVDIEREERDGQQEEE